MLIGGETKSASGVANRLGEIGTLFSNFGMQEAGPKKETLSDVSVRMDAAINASKSRLL